MSRPLQDFCWRGHPLQEPNVRYKSNGVRECWACRRITWWQAQEVLAPDKDHRLLSRVYANTYDLLGHDPQTFVLPYDAHRLVDPTKEWLTNEALLFWFGTPDCELQSADLGLENIDVLFLARPSCDRVLLLKPRKSTIKLDGLCLVEVHPDGSSTWWGPFTPPDSGSYCAASPHEYGPFQFPSTKSVA